MKTHLLVFGSTGAGKALRDDERIWTPQGWRRMDSLVEGELVSTPDGSTARIAGIFPQGDQPLWAFSLNDERSLESTSDHQWGVYLDEGNDLITMTTAQVSERLKSGSQLAVPLTQPLDGPALPYDPTRAVAALVRRLNTGIDLPLPTDGSLEQRKALWKALAQQMGYVHARSRLRLNVKHQAGAVWLSSLARSLGAWAKPEATASGWRAEARFDLDRVTVESVVATGTSAPCRCIELDDPRGLFVAGDGMVTHNTETLISMAFNSLVHGSGFIYVDGKGDNTLWAKIFSICRSMGREDDLLVVNYMTGGRDVFGPQKNKLSNTLNPFSMGSAGGLTELLVSLMDEAGGDNAMWKGRAISLISGVMFALVYMRVNEGLLLDVDVIRDYLILENIQKLSKRRDLPPYILQSIRAYLRSLPGYQEQAAKQSETVLDQHGYLQMQFTRILGSLSDTYGYIFRTNLGEVDFFDVVVNRRILVVLLPALEKSPDELGNLGKIIVASLKQMMATGLGESLEGDYEDVIEIKPTSSPSPYMCILDEYGYYVVKGAAVMPAQARSLGFCMVFAGQDYPAFKKNNNAEEAVSTIGNCNIKIFMKVEDPTDTFDLFKQSVGEADVVKTGGWGREQGLLTSSYMDQKNASVDRRSRGDLLDLKDQGPGEAHIIFKSTLVRANLFYVNPKKVKKMQLNHFLRVEPPDRQDMLDLDAGIEDLRQRLNNTRLLSDHAAGTKTPMRLAVAQAVLSELKSRHGGDLAQALAGAIVAAHQISYSNLDSLGGISDQDDDDDDHPHRMDIFAEDIDSEDEEEHEEDDEDGMDPIMLNEQATRSGLADMEMAAGASREEAQTQAAAMAADMRVMSSYPKHPPEQVEPDQLIEIMQELSDELEDGAS